MGKSKQKFIENIHKSIFKVLNPDITFILKVSEKMSKLRLKKKKN